MTFRRIRPGGDYLARLRSAVLSAADGDTIVVPGIREAVAAYCLARQQGRGLDLCWHYESPWRIYRVLPEWAAALRHGDLVADDRELLLDGIRAVMRHLGGEPIRLDSGLFYERDGIQVLARLEAGTSKNFAAELRPDCSGAILVCRRGSDFQESNLIHQEGCPVAIVDLDSSCGTRFFPGGGDGRAV